jgi:hypothetical protein
MVNVEGVLVFGWSIHVTWLDVWFQWSVVDGCSGKASCFCDLMASFVSVSIWFARAALRQVVTVCGKAVRKKFFIVSEMHVVCGLLPEECMSSWVSLGPSHQLMEQNLSDEL